MSTPLLTSGRSLAALCVALTSLLVSAGPVAAQGVDYRDPAGDMWRDNFIEGGYLRAPAIRNGDVLTTRVRHGLGAVHIRQTFTELNRANLALLDSSISIWTSDRRFRYANFFWSAPDPFDQGGSGVDFGMVSREDGLGIDRLPCKGITHELNWARNFIAVHIPRNCLGNPRFVRVNTGGSSVYAAGTFRAYYDDAHRPGPPTRVASWTPRLYRG